MSSDINQNILNFLRRRANTEVFDIAGKKIKQVRFGDSEYLINSLQNRKKMETEILYLLDDNGLISIDNYYNEVETVIKTIRHFLQEVM